MGTIQHLPETRASFPLGSMFMASHALRACLCTAVHLYLSGDRHRLMTHGCFCTQYCLGDFDSEQNNTTFLSRTVLQFALCKPMKTQGILHYATENGSGRRAKPAGTTVAGKTATAQSGWYRDDGTEITHAWYCGYFPYESPQYSVAVLKEDGQGGSVDCAPIFRYIADGIGYERCKEKAVVLSRECGIHQEPVPFVGEFREKYRPFTGCYTGRDGERRKSAQ